MKVLFRFSKHFTPPFSDLEINLVAREAKLTFNLDLNSPYRWTPLIQKIPQSDDFIKQMKRFQRLKLIEPSHYHEIVDSFLFEATKGTDFDYYYDYECKPNRYCPFHGELDFLLYHKINKYPIIPVLMARPNTAFQPLTKELDMNIAQPVAAALWALTNMYYATGEKIQKAHAVQTDGNHWRIIELCTRDKFKKSGVYCSENEFNKIFFDYGMQQVILGLIRFSLQQPTEGEQALKLVYDFVDERRYLSDKSEPARPSRIWKVLPKSVQRFFF